MFRKEHNISEKLSVSDLGWKAWSHVLSSVREEEDENGSSYRNIVLFSEYHPTDNARGPDIPTSRASGAARRQDENEFPTAARVLISLKQKRPSITTEVIWQCLHVSAYRNHHQTPTSKICNGMLIIDLKKSGVKFITWEILYLWNSIWTDWLKSYQRPPVDYTPSQDCDIVISWLKHGTVWNRENIHRTTAGVK